LNQVQVSESMMCDRLKESGESSSEAVVPMSVFLRLGMIVLRCLVRRMGFGVAPLAGNDLQQAGGKQKYCERREEPSFVTA
jgi:hypothetical protein